MQKWRKIAFNQGYHLAHRIQSYIPPFLKFSFFVFFGPKHGILFLFFYWSFGHCTFVPNCAQDSSVRHLEFFSTLLQSSSCFVPWMFYLENFKKEKRKFMNMEKNNYREQRDKQQKIVGLHEWMMKVTSHSKLENPVMVSLSSID